jgi:hypothetical protein
MTRATSLDIKVPEITGLGRSTVPSTPADVTGTVDRLADAQLPPSDFFLAATKSRHAFEVSTDRKVARRQRIAVTGLAASLLIATTGYIGTSLFGGRADAPIQAPDAIEQVQPIQRAPLTAQQLAVNGICANLAQTIATDTREGRPVDTTYYDAMCLNDDGTPHSTPPADIRPRGNVLNPIN